ncbi:MAG: hypothetical protein QGH77_08045, partial [Planctomycetota bacterium]|nr:hypothetical protein [Planctomycetota bacterium]
PFYLDHDERRTWRRYHSCELASTRKVSWHHHSCGAGGIDRGCVVFSACGGEPNDPFRRTFGRYSASGHQTS